MEKSAKGFIPVMLTPFCDDGCIDFHALELLTAHYLKAGVKGLFANCLSSEMFELSQNERVKLTRSVVDIAAGAVPVVATGTFGGAIADQADFIKRIYDTGVQAVILITSLIADQDASDECFEDRVGEVLHLTPDIPLGFYECPVPFKRVLKPEQLSRFVATGRVTYHKDTSLDIEQVKAKIAVTQQVQFGLYDAYMVHALESLRAGSAGLSCIQGNFFPELIVWLCEHCLQTEMDDTLRALQNFLTLNMDVMHNVYPYAAKYALQKQGLPISTFTRRDVGHFSTENARSIHQLYTDYNNLRQQIGL